MISGAVEAPSCQVEKLYGMSMNCDGINCKLHIKTPEAFESGSKAPFACGPGRILWYFNEPKNPRSRIPLGGDDGL